MFQGYGVGGQGGYYVPMGYWGYQQGYHPQMQQAMQPGGYMQQQQQPPYNQMNYAQQQGYGGEQGYGFANYGSVWFISATCVLDFVYVLEYFKILLIKALQSRQSLLV